MKWFDVGDWTVRLKPEARPREIAVELSTSCELGCVHCFRRSARGFTETYMELGKFSRILENAVQSGVEKVTLTGWGEPTMHPDFNRVMELLGSSGLRVVLNTNGRKLLELYDIVVESVDELVVSMDAATLELYGRIRTGGSLPEVIEGLKKIARLKRLRPLARPTIKIIFTITKLNAREAGSLLKLARELAASEVIYSYYIPLPGGSELDCASDAECVRSFVESVDKAKWEFPELGLRLTTPQRPPGAPGVCPFASSRALYVRVDGIVTPCIYYSRTWKTKLLGVERTVNEVVLGSALEESLLDIWRNRYQELYYRLAFKVMPSCFTCVLASYCPLTRTNELDCLGNYPTCAHCPFYHGLTYCPL